MSTIDSYLRSIKKIRSSDGSYTSLAQTYVHQSRNLEEVKEKLTVIVLKQSDLFSINALSHNLSSLSSDDLLSLQKEFLLSFSVNRAHALYGMFVSKKKHIDYLSRTASDYLERVAELTYLVTGIRSSEEELSSLKGRIDWLVLFDRLTDYVKYYTNYVYTRSKELENPKRVNIFGGMEFVFPSTLCRWIKLKGGKNHVNREQVRIGFLTIFQGFKKALLPVSPLKVFESACDHASALGKAPEDVPEELVNNITRKADILMKHLKVGDLTDCQTESRAASYECTRSTGGSTRFLIELYRTKMGMYGPSTEEFRGYCETWGLGDGPNVKIIRTIYPDYKHLLRETLEWQPLMKVRPAFILEPLKVRTVTLATSLGQRYFSPIQKSVWKFLQSFKMFELIGRPLEKNDVENICNLMGDHQKLLSGDWKGATDNLSGVVSGIFMDRIKQSLKCSDDAILIDTLNRMDGMSLNAQVEYSNCFPKVDGVKWDSIEMKDLIFKNLGLQLPDQIDQRTGQLMGSKLSFIILVMVNFVLHWISCEMEEGREMFYEDCDPCLCNGDDYLSVASESRYEIWDKLCSSVGLKKSVGKNFFSRGVAQINSETFYLKKSEGEDGLSSNGTLFHIPYVNMGLLHGRGKGMDPTQDQWPDDINGHKRFTRILDSGKVRNTESSSDDFSSQESALGTVYTKYMCGLPGKIATRAKELWNLQMLYCKWSLKKYNITNIELPGNSIWDFTEFSELMFITTIEGTNTEKFQSNFPEFSLNSIIDYSIDIGKRRKRANELKKMERLPLEDIGRFPAMYHSISAFLIKQEHRKSLKETLVHY